MTKVTADERLMARVLALILRKMPEDLARGFFDSPEWRDLDPEEKDLIYVADAELEELERRQRQKIKQQQAEEDYRRRVAGGEEDTTA